MADDCSDKLMKANYTEYKGLIVITVKSSLNNVQLQSKVFIDLILRSRIS